MTETVIKSSGARPYAHAQTFAPSARCLQQMFCNFHSSADVVAATCGFSLIFSATFRRINCVYDTPLESAIFVAPCHVFVVPFRQVRSALRPVFAGRIKWLGNHFLHIFLYVAELSDVLFHRFSVAFTASRKCRDIIRGTCGK